MRFLRLDADAFVEKEWQKGGDDEQRDARQQTVPADLLEEQEQDTTPIIEPPKLPIDCMLFARLLSFRLKASTANASVAISCVAEATKDMMIKVTIV